METKISVVIPTYKRPKLLIECLISLSKQTLAKADFEVVVISDGPDAKTYKQIKLWAKSQSLKINYFQTPQKGGPAAARNLGWRSANYSLIAFTDDDCRPAPDWLENFVKQYKGEELMVFSGFTYVPIPLKPSDYELNIANLQTADFITANCACTINALIQVQGFDEQFKAAWREDSDLEFKFLTRKIPIDKINSAVVIHPVRKVPWGVSLKEQKKGIYDALLYKKFPKLYRSKIQSDPLWNYYFINLLWIMIAISSLSLNIYLLVTFICLQIILLSIFVYKRLKLCKKTASHITEMLVTSVLIPTLSVFWRFYGALKFRVILI